MEYASNLRYNPGAPGPSLTWSAFGQTPESAAAEVGSDRLLTIVSERLEESLVLLSRYMSWSLADVVTVKSRKNLSRHPPYEQWDPQAVNVMRNRLEGMGEYLMYVSM